MSENNAAEMRQINYVFVDLQNLPKPEVFHRKTKRVHYTILVGPEQKEHIAKYLPALLERSIGVHVIPLPANGKNALDFALAYHLGQAVEADPKGYFHIISKDKDFEPLIHYLHTRNVRVTRHEDYRKLTFLPASTRKAKPLTTTAAS